MIRFAQVVFVDTALTANSRKILTEDPHPSVSIYSSFFIISVLSQGGIHDFHQHYIYELPISRNYNYRKDAETHNLSGYRALQALIELNDRGCLQNGIISYVFARGYYYYNGKIVNIKRVEPSSKNFLDYNDTTYEVSCKK